MPSDVRDDREAGADPSRSHAAQREHRGAGARVAAALSVETAEVEALAGRRRRTSSCGRRLLRWPDGTGERATRSATRPPARVRRPGRRRRSTDIHQCRAAGARLRVGSRPRCSELAEHFDASRRRARVSPPRARRRGVRPLRVPRGAELLRAGARSDVGVGQPARAERGAPPSRGRVARSTDFRPSRWPRTSPALDSSRRRPGPRGLAQVLTRSRSCTSHARIAKRRGTGASSPSSRRGRGRWPVNGAAPGGDRRGLGWRPPQRSESFTDLFTLHRRNAVSPEILAATEWRRSCRLSRTTATTGRSDGAHRGPCRGARPCAASELDKPNRSRRRQLVLAQPLERESQRRRRPRDERPRPRDPAGLGLRRDARCDALHRPRLERRRRSRAEVMAEPESEPALFGPLVGFPERALRVDRGSARSRRSETPRAGCRRPRRRPAPHAPRPRCEAALVARAALAEFRTRPRP